MVWAKEKAGFETAATGFLSLAATVVGFWAALDFVVIGAVVAVAGFLLAALSEAKMLDDLFATWLTRALMGAGVAVGLSPGRFCNVLVVAGVGLDASVVALAAGSAGFDFFARGPSLAGRTVESGAGRFALFTSVDSEAGGGLALAFLEPAAAPSMTF
jgi:hypothetical protein